MNAIISRHERLTSTCGRAEAETETGTTRKASANFKVIALLVCGVLFGLGQANAQNTTNVYVDPSADWIGYINAYTTTNMPVQGSDYITGDALPTSDMDAGFAGAVASFAPSTWPDSIPPTDPTYPEYWNADGSPNSIIDANFYVDSTNLANNYVTFSGYCWTNTLIAPYSTNVVAFVKDLTSGYQLVDEVTSNLTGGFFSITLPINPGDHGQYGFEMMGPPEQATNESAAGSVIIASNPPPAGPVVTSITPPPATVLIRSNLTLTATANGSGLTYQWQKGGANLANSASYSGVTTPTLTLSNVQGSAEGQYTIQITDSALRKTNASTFVVVLDPNNLSFDPNLGFNGYINGWPYSGPEFTGGNTDTGFGYPLNILIAGMNNGTAYMQPNTTLFDNDLNSTFWVNNGPGQWVEQDFYIGNDLLGGKGLNLTFAGFCPSNSIPAPYVESAWIEDFSSGYALSGSVTTNLIAGQAFSITLATSMNAGDHIQYGLRVFGPDNSSTNPVTATEMFVSPPQPTLSATISNKTVNLSFGPTALGHNYGIQYTTNLSNPNWQTITTLPGVDAAQTLSDTPGASSRFYRVQVE